MAEIVQYRDTARVQNNMAASYGKNGLFLWRRAYEVTWPPVIAAIVHHRDTARV